MKISLAAVLSLAILAGINLPAFAASSVGGVIIDYVTVGNAGNEADTADGNSRTAGVQRCGAVAYEYKIAKNETTIGQYCEFLNAVAKSDPYSLYNPKMTTSYSNGVSRGGSSGSYNYTVNPGSANKPITFVSWFDAARMCNWLHNGQGNGSTETGAYTLIGALSGIYTKNAGATVWIPSENEWYKAAYYDATKGGTGGYWQYATQSNTLGGNTIGVPSSANYYDGDWVGFPGMALTDVGAYGANSDSFYGTNDQGGNVNEWIDDGPTGSTRGLRGGAWASGESDLGSSFCLGYVPSDGFGAFGFRVASVPEPSCVFLTLLASGVLVTRRKR